MKASYDGSTVIASELLNAGAKTDLQNEVRLVHLHFNVGTQCRELDVYSKQDVL